MMAVTGTTGCRTHVNRTETATSATADSVLTAAMTRMSAASDSITEESTVSITAPRVTVVRKHDPSGRVVATVHTYSAARIDRRASAGRVTHTSDSATIQTESAYRNHSESTVSAEKKRGGGTARLRVCALAAAAVIGLMLTLRSRFKTFD